MTTNFQIARIANHLFGLAAGNTPPNGYFVGLLLSIPNPDGTNINEVTSVLSGYARQLLPNNKTNLTIANNGRVSNVSQVTFPTATSPWGTIMAVGIFDSSSGGNLLYYSVQPTAKSFDVGDQAFFDVGDIFWQVQNITD